MQWRTKTISRTRIGRSPMKQRRSGLPKPSSKSLAKKRQRAKPNTCFARQSRKLPKLCSSTSLSFKRSACSRKASLKRRRSKRCRKCLISTGRAQHEEEMTNLIQMSKLSQNRMIEVSQAWVLYRRWRAISNLVASKAVIARSNLA
jgi:hypothetical protein